MKKFVFHSVLFALMFSFVSFARAEDLGAVKARMEQRYDHIKELKTQGEVGENNRGYLEVRGGSADAGSVVAAENKDREVVYSALAKQTGSTVELVGKTRARKLAQNAGSGEWLQDESGNWKKK